MASASNAESTAKLLESKSVVYEPVDRKEPRPFEKVWEDLKEELRHHCNAGADELPSAADALKLLVPPMVNAFRMEDDFDKALFEALRKCLTNCELQLGIDDAIAVKVNVDANHAIAISRQKAVAQDLCRKNQKGETSKPTRMTSTGLKVKSTPDHAVCLFKKNGDWCVKDCFAIVEIKMSDSSCDVFPVMSSNTVCKVDLEGGFKPLGQAILYTLGAVLLYHARRGLLPNHFPIAMIAGIRKAKDKTNAQKAKRQKIPAQKIPTKLRWFSATLNVPEDCADKFSYSVQDFGRFMTDEEADLGSVKQALSVYLDTILFGLTSAIKVHNDLTNTDVAPPSPVPASGKNFKIGKKKMRCQFCASPIFGANQFRNIGRSFEISQGELFQGRIFLHSVLWEAKLAHMQFVDFVPRQILKRKVKPFLVKLSSKAVHGPIVSPFVAMDAMKMIQQADDQEDLVKEIGTVLRVAVQIGVVGLVTIMVDLSKQGYRPLKPEAFRGKISVLWAAFIDLVENMLLPLAALDIVHADIRAGYDETANIFCWYDKKRKVAKMKLVDYESLVLLEHWDPPGDGRYIQVGRKWNATKFVWWQCIIVAYTWYGKVSGHALKVMKIEELQDQMMKGSIDQGWLKDFQLLAKGTISADTVRKTIAAIADLMKAAD